MSEDGARVGQYIRAPKGYFVVVKGDDGTEISIRLSNFTARITSDLILDDGVEEAHQYEITADVDGTVKMFQVEAAKFSQVDAWVSQHLGSKAILTARASTQRQFREAVQWHSSAKVRRVHTHTGWTSHDGKLVFLHAGGGIGANGPVDVEVSLPLPLDRYRLPQPATGEALVAAIRSSLLLLFLGPSQVMAPILAAVYRAPLPMPVDFVLWVVGASGIYKTEVVSLAQCHLGDFDSRHLPASWTSTANYLEQLLFITANVLVVIDDWLPSGSPVERAHQAREAEQITRSVGNASGRGRLRADASSRTARPPRGSVIATAEEFPGGVSSRGRSFVDEIRAGDIKADVLTLRQRESGSYRFAMASYIQYLAINLDAIAETYKSDFTVLRAEAAKAIGEGQHARTAAIVAELQFGATVFLEFALARGAISQNEYELYKATFWEGLVATSANQGARVREVEPTRRFVELLVSALASGRAHLAAPDGGTPGLYSEAWGWRQGEGRGDRIGWIDNETVYLEPDAAHRVACAGDGNAITISAATLRRRLAEKNMLSETGLETPRHTYTVRRVLQGARREVLVLRVSTFHPAAEAEF